MDFWVLLTLGSRLHVFREDMTLAYDEQILDAGKRPVFLLLVAFLVTFLLVRFITHAIKAGRFHRVLHNLSAPGGKHLHHLVPGIILVLLSGYMMVGLGSGHAYEPWAVLFGIGAALTLDEFALWFNLEDVYWEAQGRRSIDAVIVAIVALAIGAHIGWFWVDSAQAVGRLVKP